VQLLDVVVAHHGGGQLRVKHRVHFGATKHQVLCVHCNTGRAGGRGPEGESGTQASGMSSSLLTAH
jgi:hypothetical protein